MTPIPIFWGGVRVKVEHITVSSVGVNGEGGSVVKTTEIYFGVIVALIGKRFDM